MALSENTQAIIDRLKAEGDLVRNSGTNSVRSVKFKLDKFENIQLFVKKEDQNLREMALDMHH